MYVCACNETLSTTVQLIQPTSDGGNFPPIQIPKNQCSNLMTSNPNLVPSFVEQIHHPTSFRQNSHNLSKQMVSRLFYRKWGLAAGCKSSCTHPPFAQKVNVSCYFQRSLHQRATRQKKTHTHTKLTTRLTGKTH